jgi:hypothetical protein
MVLYISEAINKLKALEDLQSSRAKLCFYVFGLRFYIANLGCSSPTFKRCW